MHGVACERHEGDGRNKAGKLTADTAQKHCDYTDEHNADGRGDGLIQGGTLAENEACQDAQYQNTYDQDQGRLPKGIDIKIRKISSNLIHN